MTGCLLAIGFVPFERADCQTEQSFDSLVLQAAQARDANRLDEAASLYRKAVDIRPNWTEGWFYLGTIAYDQDQFGPAAEALTKASSLAPGDAKCLAMLGLSEARLNRAQAALNHLSQAVSLGVGDEGNLRRIVLFNQARLLLDRGSFGQAQEIVDRLAQQRDTLDQSLLISLGRSVLGIESAGAAETAPIREMVLAAGNAEMLAANRDIESAKVAYSELVKRFPKAHNVEFAYGRFLLRNHLDDEAVDAFKREIANDPRHLLARLGIAGALLQRDPQVSATYAKQAVALAPKLEEAHYLYGAALLATDNTEAALPELEMAESLKPNDPRIYFLLAKIYQRVNRPTEAAKAREKFQSLNQTK